MTRPIWKSIYFTFGTVAGIWSFPSWAKAIHHHTSWFYVTYHSKGLQTLSNSKTLFLFQTSFLFTNFPPRLPEDKKFPHFICRKLCFRSIKHYSKNSMACYAIFEIINFFNRLQWGIPWKSIPTRIRFKAIQKQILIESPKPLSVQMIVYSFGVTVWNCGQNLKNISNSIT